MTVFASSPSAAFAVFIVRHRWAVAILSLVAALVIAMGQQQITFSADHRVFFSDNNPQMVAYDQLQESYTRTDSILIMIRDERGGLFTRERLDLIVQTTNQAWMTPHSIRVDSLTNYQHTDVNGDELIIDHLVRDGGQLDDAAIERIRAIALAEPSLAGRLISRDGKATGIIITLHLPDGDPMAGGRALAHARTIVDALKGEHDDLDIALTGLLPLSHTYPEASARDLAVLFPAMYAIILVILALMLRSVLGVIVIMAALALSSIGTLGIAGWAGIALTPPTAMLPTIVLAIVVADSVHIFSHVQNAIHRGLPRDQAIIESLVVNMAPVFWTSLTTAIGFLSLNFSESPPYRELGTLAAGGTVIAWLLSITFVPAWIAILPIKGRPERSPTMGAVNRVVDIAMRHRRLVLWGSAAALAGSLLLSSRMTIDDRILENFDHSFAVRGDSEMVLNSLTGIYQLEFSVATGRPGGVSDPDYLRRLDQFSQWLASQSEIVHVSSITDTIKRIGRVLNHDDPAHYRLPDDQVTAAQYLLVYENSLPYGLNLFNAITMDQSATRVVATLGRLTTAEIIAIKERAEAWLRLNGTPAMASEGTGTAVMFSYLTDHNIRAMLWGTATMLLVITVSMLIALRNWRLALISLVPNITPVFLTFGIWSLFAPQIATPASMVTAICLGLIIDATIHLMIRYREAREELGLTSEDAVRHAYAVAGRALVVTSAIMALGFAVLGLSPFKMNADLGWMTALLILAGFVMDFVLLPATLVAFDRQRAECDADAPTTESAVVSGL